MMLLALLACVADREPVDEVSAPDSATPHASATVPEHDPSVAIIDFHTHCPTDGTPCDAASLERSRGGTVFTVVAGLSHYRIAETLGDPLPDEVRGLRDNNEQVLAVSSSPNALLMPSLECLFDTPGSDPAFTEACLEDADRWLARGAVGFKDHAGKTFDGSGYDIALWVGAYNRLAGWCDVTGDATPNRSCLAQDTLRFPLSVPAYRDLILRVVEDRGAAWLTHAVPWSGSEETCGTPTGPRRCHDVAADALVDFARWAEDEMSPDARRRIVVGHLGFLQDDETRLRAVLDAGLTVDLAQTDFVNAGCDLRTLVAEYPDQVVLGTDVTLGPDCVERHHDAWVHALVGPAGEVQVHRDTCRGTLNPVGADLDRPQACGVEVPEGAGRAVLYGNAARILGWW